MPVDLEQQLAALGKFWNKTIAHVEMSEIVARDTTRRGRSRIGIEGLAAAPTPDQPPETYQFTEGDVTMIDLQTSSQTDEPRKGPKRVLLAGLLAAAAVVAIALVAIRRDAPESPADQPSTTVTVPPTTPPQALFGSSDAQLAPGTYVVDKVEETPTTPILVTVGAGWRSFEDWAIDKGEGEGEAQAMTFTRPDRVSLDACHPSDGYHPGPLTTLDGMVTALSEQRGWVGVTTPTDISIDGYAGKAFRRATPTDLSTCPEGRFHTADDGTSVYGPGETVSVWVLDLDRTIVVLETRVSAGQPAEAHAELAAILDSIRIAPA
jgi:hypothetical protein